MSTKSNLADSVLHAPSASFGDEEFCPGLLREGWRAPGSTDQESSAPRWEQAGCVGITARLCRDEPMDVDGLPLRRRGGRVVLALASGDMDEAGGVVVTRGQGEALHPGSPMVPISEWGPNPGYPPLRIQQLHLLPCELGVGQDSAPVSARRRARGGLDTSTSAHTDRGVRPLSLADGMLVRWLASAALRGRGCS
jgi:hypothetical protein